MQRVGGIGVYMIGLFMYYNIHFPSLQDSVHCITDCSSSFSLSSPPSPSVRTCLTLMVVNCNGIRVVIPVPHSK